MTTITNIGTGTYPNDTTGTPLQTAGQIINANFAALNTTIGTLPVLPGTYTYATLPAASANTGKSAYTSDQGPVYSNGTSWVTLTGTNVAGLAGATVATLKSGPVPTRLIGVGCSLDSGSTAYGGGTLSQMYMQLLAANYNFNTLGSAPNGTTYIDTAVAGTVHVSQITASNNALSFASTDLIVAGNFLFNNMRIWGPDPSIYMVDLQQSIEAFLAFFAIPESLKVRAIIAGTTTLNTTNVVDSGAGSGWPYYSLTVGTQFNNMARRSAIASDTLTFTPPTAGDTVYIWYFRGLLDVIASLTVDGVTYTVGGPVTYADRLAANTNYELMLLRVTGLANTTHTVVITAPSAGAFPGYFSVFGVACFNSATIATLAPAVVVGNVAPMIPLVSGVGYDYAGAKAQSQIATTAINGQASSAISVTASPFTYTAPYTGLVTITGGTVSVVSNNNSSAGANIFNYSGAYPITAGDQLTVTYSSAPTMAFFPTVPQRQIGHSAAQMFSDMITRAVTNLAADGLRVSCVDIGSQLLVSSTPSVAAPDVGSDGVHLSPSGYQKVFQRMKKVVDKIMRVS